MKTLKKGVILLVLLLAAMAMVPMVNAEDQTVRSADSGKLNTSVNYPQHIIPYDYLKDSKPAEWLPESDMVNIILSQKTLERYGQNSNSDIIEIPLTYLESESNFVKLEKFPGYKIEDGVGPDNSIVLIRMPTQLYDTSLKGDVDGKLSLPSTYFCRFYSNFDDLSSHMTKEDNGVVKITPSSQYPVPGLLDGNTTSVNAQNSAVGKASSALLISGIGKEVRATLNDPQNYTQWARTSRLGSTNYKYSIGQIRPYSWSLSGSGADLFRLYAEREYKFNNGEALEIVAHFLDRNGGGGIELYPAFYRDGAQYPIGTNQWSHWEGPVVIDPNDIPHAYGYHVQITNSGAGFQVNFEDMETLTWTTYYTVTAASTVSSFTELDGSSEYLQGTVPSTDTFSETTDPVIEEWVIDVNDVWHKPNAVWQTPYYDPPTSPSYVSVVRSWDSNGNLITTSYAHYP